MRRGRRAFEWMAILALTVGSVMVSSAGPAGTLNAGPAGPAARETAGRCNSAGHIDSAHVRGGPAGRQPALRPLRAPALPHLPLHGPHEPDRPPFEPGLAHARARERVPQARRPPRPRGTDLQLRRQGDRRRDVLREPVDQVRRRGLPRGVGGAGRGVQLPGLAQLGHGLSGGLRDGPPRGRQRVRLGGQHRSSVRDAVASRAHPPAGPLAPRAGDDALQPQRRAPPLLLVDDGLGRRRRRLAHPLPHGVLGLPLLRRRRRLAGGLFGRRPQLPAQPPRGLRVPLRPRQPRAVHGRLPPHDRVGDGARGRSSRHARQEDLVLGMGRRGQGLAPRALRRPERLPRGPGRPLPQPGDLRVPRAPAAPAVPRDLPAVRKIGGISRANDEGVVHVRRGERGALQVGLNLTPSSSGRQDRRPRRDGDGPRGGAEPRALRRLRSRLGRPPGARTLHRRGARREGPCGPGPHRGPLRRRAEGRGEDRPPVGPRLPAAREAQRGRLGGARPPPGAERQAPRGPRRLRGGARRASRQPGAPARGGTSRRPAQALRRSRRAPFEGGGAEEQRRRGALLPRPRSRRPRPVAEGSLRLGPGGDAPGLAGRVAASARPARLPRGVRS